ncbi:MAG: PHP domain-containing protein [Chloroflexota bacterium]
MGTIDLHSHTVASDGRLTPRELVQLAHRNGVQFLSITDHDTTDGLDEAIAEAAGLGIEIIPGIEVSCDIPGTEVHLLGFYLNYNDPEFQTKIAGFREGRVGRAQEMVRKLGELGAPITWERVKEIAGDGSVGRPHVAQALLEAGHIQAIPEAFDRWIGRNGPAYAEREKLTLEDAIALIHSVGGIASIAHPYESEGLMDLLPGLVSNGLDAIECYYTGYAADRRDPLLSFIRTNNLIASGGSDYHGFPMAGLKEVTNVPGSVDVPVSVIDAMRDRLAHRV